MIGVKISRRGKGQIQITNQALPCRGGTAKGMLELSEEWTMTGAMLRFEVKA